MITPLDTFVECDVNHKSNYRCLQLAPNGTMLAAVTINSVQIWSTQLSNTLLCSRIQNRPQGYSKALLNRIFLIWNENSDQFVVIRSEGIVDYYHVTFRKHCIDDVFEDQYTPLYYESASINFICSIAIDKYGYPTSACLLNNRIIIVNDSGTLSELNWNGNLNCYSLNKFIPTSLQTEDFPLKDRYIRSVSASSELHCLAIALDNGVCLLVDIPSNSIQATHMTVLRPTLQDGIRQILFSSGLPFLAIISSRLSIEIYSLSYTSNNSLSCSKISLLDIRQFPQLNTSPLFSYDVITSICWCPGKPIIAIGLKYQGIMVCDMNGTLIYSYNEDNQVLSNLSSKKAIGHSPFDDTELAMACEVSCCCFNMSGTLLFFNIPYDQVILNTDNEIFSRDSRFLCQQFCVFSDVIYATFLLKFIFLYIVKIVPILGIPVIV